MHFDETRIAIRERNGLEVLDLSVTLLRVFLRPCLTLFMIGAAPFIAWNFLLTYWMPILDNDAATIDVAGTVWRYLWAQTLLVFIQAPLAASFVTSFLGRAAFDSAPSYREVLADVRLAGSKLIWSMGIVRLAFPVSLALLTLDRAGPFQARMEIVMMGTACLVVAVTRIGRPFLPEIIILEKNPFRTTEPDTITVVRRNRELHSLNSGELVVRWATTSLVCLTLFSSIYFTLLFLQGMFFNLWTQNSIFMLYIAIPTALWTSALFVSLARYLNYLDQRIRYEGWEVELKLKAEGRRLVATPLAK
ncbi:MAG: hypothetical protein VB878_07225 [Pirellulaceae bacterium]